MTALTVTELERFRRKVGDTGESKAFSDPELQDIYQEAGGDFNRAVLLAYEELIGNAWKFSDYTQNESQERKSQIFANLMKTRDMWQSKLSKGKQVAFVGMRSIPPRQKDVPVESDDDLYKPKPGQRYP